MKKIKLLALICLMSLSFGSIKTFAHCEIPCGIYDDTAKITLMLVHIQTIEKSMKLIIELSSAEKPDYNQLVRWVNNKEEHASKLQTRMFVISIKRAICLLILYFSNSYGGRYGRDHGQVRKI